MELLKAVNCILPKLGEDEVSSTTVRHPTVAIILSELERQRKELLLKGWWFNEFSYTAMPDNEGHITLGGDVLRFLPEYAGTAVQRGDKLYNPETLAYVFTESVRGTVTQDIDFQLLPETAANAVMYAALVSQTVTDLGVVDDLKMWTNAASLSYSELYAEHLRNKSYGTRKSRKWQRYNTARSM